MGINQDVFEFGNHFEDLTSKGIFTKKECINTLLKIGLLDING